MTESKMEGDKETRARFQFSGFENHDVEDIELYFDRALERTHGEEAEELNERTEKSLVKLVCERALKQVGETQV